MTSTMTQSVDLSFVRRAGPHLGGAALAVALTVAFAAPAQAQYQYAYPYAQPYGHPAYGQTYAQPQVYVQPQVYPYAVAQPRIVERRSPDRVVRRRQAPAAAVTQRQSRAAERQLIEELRRRKVPVPAAEIVARAPQAAAGKPARQGSKGADARTDAASAAKIDRKIDSKSVIYEKPIVIERRRYVDDPPVVVQRHHVVDVPAPVPDAAAQVDTGAAPPAGPGYNGPRGRVIHAEAEVTILGPDRMSIRLYRKGRGLDANAKAAE